MELENARSRRAWKNQFQYMKAKWIVYFIGRSKIQGSKRAWERWVCFCFVNAFFLWGVESNSIVASMSKWSYNKTDSSPSFFPQFGFESTNDTSVFSYAWKTSLRLNSSNDGIKQCIFAKPFLIITFLKIILFRTSSSCHVNRLKQNL